MSFRSRLPLALALLGFTLATSEAGAQSLALLPGTQGVEWPGDYDHGGLHIEQINQNDCIQNPTIEFNLTLGTPVTSSFQNYEIEAWIGTACDTSLATARTTGQCVEVGATSVAAHFIDVPVQNLLVTLNGGEEVTSTGGTGGIGGTGGTLDVGGTGGTFSASGTFGTFAEVAGLGGTLGFGGTEASGGADASGGGGAGAGTSMAGDGGALGMGGVAGTLGAAGTLGSSGASGLAGSGVAGTGAVVGVPSTGGDTSVASGGDTSISGTGGDTGTAGTGATTGISIPAVCEGDPSVPTPEARTLFFMLVDPSSGSVYGASGGVLKWTFDFDLVGPDAPSDVVAGIGENVLVVNWTEASEDTDLYQYQLLCDPPPNAGAGTILGAAGDEGDDDDSDTSLPPNDQCYTAAFTPGASVSPATMAAYNCGVAQLTSTNAEARPLQNYVRYTVAVVAEDQYHNFGPVSNFSCATPEPVTDFYEAYRAAGGKGGGGFCSISSQRSHALTALLLAGSFALFARRRAKRQGQRRNRA